MIKGKAHCGAIPRSEEKEEEGIRNLRVKKVKMQKQPVNSRVYKRKVYMIES